MRKCGNSVFNFFNVHCSLHLVDFRDSRGNAMKAWISPSDVPVGSSVQFKELRQAKINRMEATGDLDPNCKGCKPYYEHPTVLPFAPSHKASNRCESGKYPHCTCDTCF